MPNPLYTFENLQTLEQYKPKIINGTFTFDESTEDIEFVDLSGHEELKQIVFKTPQKSLRYLDASNCNIKNIEIPSGLERLETLYLHGNHLQEITFKGNSPRLELLDLSNNELIKIELPFEFESLANMFLAKNDLRDLTTIAKFATRQHFELVISDNKSLQVPPQNIIDQGDEAILKYLALLHKEEEKRYNFEVKLLIIGEGGTGKTTLLRKLQDENADMPKQKDTTKGIEIEKWEFPIARERFRNLEGLSQGNMQINCWDFGGQKLYHGTHQIFFGENSYYVLVGDTREQHTDFSYWFNTVEQLAGENACLMVVVNQKHGHVLKFDKTGYHSRFNFLHDVEELDLKNDRDAIIKLQHKVKTRLQEMKTVGTPLSSTYIKIRDELFKLKENFISFDRLREISAESKLTDPKQIRILSKYFNDTGAITHFIDDTVLNNRVYLNSDWLVKTVYAVLDDETIKNKKGRICSSDFEHIFKKRKLDFEIKHLTQIMHKFGLMYKVPQVNSYVVPAHLPTEKPYPVWAHQNENRILIFKYEFDKYMPEGLMSHFIVSLHSFIEDQDLVWHRGMNICYENTFAEIIETYGGTNTFEIKITGPHQRELLAVIRDRFKSILKPFKKLVYEEKVPCNCGECKNKKEPFFHKYSDLQNLIKKEKKHVMCNESGDIIMIHELLQDVFITPENDPDFKSSKQAHRIEGMLKELQSSTLENQQYLKRIEQKQNRILIRFTETEQKLLERFVKQLDQNELRIVDALVENTNIKHIDEQPSEENEAKELLRLIKEKLDKIDMEEKEELNEMSSKLTTGAKLKLSIPIIPYILKYESDLIGFDANVSIKSWKDIWKALKKISGEDESTNQ